MTFRAPRKPSSSLVATLHAGESQTVTFRILISEDLDPNKTFTIILSDPNGVIATAEAHALVDIPDFAVRIKPSLDNYTHQPDAEVYVIVNNRQGEELRNLEVELDINKGRTTEYVQFLSVFHVPAYGKFRYRYTYPVTQLQGTGVIADGWLRQRGTLIATSNDTILSVYHPTPFENDARPEGHIRVYD